MKAALYTFALVIVAALALPASTASAWHGTGDDVWYGDRRVIDHETWCAWKRTWHAQNSLARPLRGYYVPRPKCSDFYGWGSDCGCPSGYAGPYVEANYSDPAPVTVVGGAALVGFEPVQFERLGQVPNELDIPGPPPAAPAPPATNR